MKKYLFILLILAMVFSFSGCGGSVSTMESAPSEDSGTYGQDSADMAKNEAGAVEESAEADSDGSGTAYQGAVIPGSGFVASPAQKIIFSSDISLETEKFDDTMAKIDIKVKETGSYIESSSISGTGKNDYDLRYASLIIRVPSGKFDQMKKAAEEWGTVTSSSTASQDVTKQYVDTEARIKTLKIQEERLLLLLGKAEKLEDIIVLEGRLSELRFEIESYTGTLQALDALVDYATIGVSVREVKSETYIPENFGQKLLEAVKDSIRQLGMALEGILITLIYLTPYIVLLIVLAIIIRKTGAIGKLFGNRHKKSDGSDRTPKL